MDIILASQSPRRRELLERMGIRNFRVLSPDVDEHVPDSPPPEALVRRLSDRKARAVARQVGDDALIIAADTVVALDNLVLGKPRDAQDAARMLAALSGREHQVYTGVTVRQGQKVLIEHAMTGVTFRTLSDREIGQYIAAGESLDKAGAYGIQGCGALLIEGIRGDYYNVMGLPVCTLGRMLAQFGVDVLSRAAAQS